MFVRRIEALLDIHWLQETSVVTQKSLADHRYILLTGAKWLQNKGEIVTNSRKWTDKVKITCYVLQTRSEMGRVPNLVEHLLRKKAK